MKGTRVSKGALSRTSNRSQSLLERLRLDDTGERSSTTDHIEGRILSIKRNLVHLLNSRQGGSSSTQDYGLNDLNDASVGSSDMLRIIGQNIRSVITKFEPRVHDVQVNFDQSSLGGLELGFSISAKTTIKHRDEQVTIDLVLREGRRFSERH